MSNSILLIEPDRILAKTYSEALKSVGYSVEVASSAQSAIDLADKVQPDLVILEIQLVGHSGIEFLYEFRSYLDWQQVPVVLLTNVPKQEFKSNWSILSEELGVSEYLYKPKTGLNKLLKVVGDQITVVK